MYTCEYLYVGERVCFWVWNPDFVFARQACYHWAMQPQPSFLYSWYNKLLESFHYVVGINVKF